MVYLHASSRLVVFKMRLLGLTKTVTLVNRELVTLNGAAQRAEVGRSQSGLFCPTLTAKSADSFLY